MSKMEKLPNVPEDEAKDYVRRHAAGQTIMHIAFAYDRSNTTVSRTLKAYGVVIQTKPSKKAKRYMGRF